jgi:outer membrane protein TolC
MVDVLRVDIMLRDAETNLSILNQKEKPLTTAFNNLLNRPESEAVDVLEFLSADTLASNYRRDSMIVNHPVINALELKIESTKASELAAKKQGLPKFGVGLDYVLVGERQDVAIDDNGKDAIMPMVSLSIPIFRGRYKAMVKEAQLMRESYTYEKEEYANTLGSAYERSSFTIEQQKDLIDLYNRQIRESERTLRLLFASYSNGGDSFEEVLRMQQQLLKYQKLKATALVEYQIAVEELNYITAKKR